MHIQELNNMYISPYIITVTKLKRMGWVGYAARMEEAKNAHKLLVANVEFKRQSRSYHSNM
jgi:hypothetical protein